MLLRSTIDFVEKNISDHSSIISSPVLFSLSLCADQYRMNSEYPQGQSPRLKGITASQTD